MSQSMILLPSYFVLNFLTCQKAMKLLRRLVSSKIGSLLYHNQIICTDTLTIFTVLLQAQTKIFIQNSVQLTSTFCASREGLKFDFTTTLTSIFCLPTSRTRGIIRNGRLMSLVVLYLQRLTSLLKT